MTVSLLARGLETGIIRPYRKSGVPEKSEAGFSEFAIDLQLVREQSVYSENQRTLFWMSVKVKSFFNVEGLGSTY